MEKKDPFRRQNEDFVYRHVVEAVDHAHRGDQIRAHEHHEMAIAMKLLMTETDALRPEDLL